jgi:hypothetical protein
VSRTVAAPCWCCGRVYLLLAPYRSNSKRDDKKDDDDVTQSNKALQVQNIKVDQDSGDIWLKIDHSWAKIGVINTGNFASVDADQEAKQSVNCCWGCCAGGAPGG